MQIARAPDLPGVSRPLRFARAGKASGQTPLLAALLLFLVLVLQVGAGVGGAGFASFNERWTYNAVPILAALTCFRASRRHASRTPWLLLGLAILSWGLGDLYYTFVLEQQTTIPFPSAADAGYLGYYPFVYVAIGLLVRSQIAGFVRSLWLDGVIAALTVGALASSVIFEVVLRSVADGNTSPAAVATNLAYPLADSLLLALVFGVVSLSGWRLSRSWCLLGAGFLVFGIADSVYLVRIATETYAYGSLLDLGWLLAMILIAAAATQPGERVAAATLDGRRLLIVPTSFATINLTLEVVDHFERLNLVAITLASLGLVAVLARMSLTFNEYLRVLGLTRTEAVTDALTGLGNRRALIAALSKAVSSRDEHLLLLFDLNGFKIYNDRFGHPAGDALLSRLGGRLAACVAGTGFAYRLGGDEFCAIVRAGERDLPTVLEQTMASLSERGEGFHVTPSAGSIVVPGEAQNETDALRLVDRRMYQHKESGRLAGAESHGVLVGVIEARDPHLAHHTGLVARLARELALELGLDAATVASVKVVAELHDIGKVAVPDGILDKAAPLTDQEWRLVRQHTVAGERIVNRAPGLEHVGEAIRSTHERWDGTGYPDSLRHAEIPIEARIVAVADAYEAMTSGDRPYRARRTHEDAVAEIMACAGTQFDPAVVAAFARALAERGAGLAGTTVAASSAAAGRSVLAANQG